MEYLSYNKVPVQVGDTVYQMDAGRIKVLTFAVQTLRPNGVIEVEGGLPNYKQRFAAPAKQFHTDAKALVGEWVKTHLHNYEVNLPKFLYNLLKLYREVGGEITDEQINRFAVVRKDEVI